MSSLCSSSRIYEPRSLYRINKKPSAEFSWFSVALRNLSKDESQSEAPDSVPSSVTTSTPVPSTSLSTKNSPSSSSPLPPILGATSDDKNRQSTTTVCIQDPSSPASVTTTPPTSTSIPDSTLVLNSELSNEHNGLKLPNVTIANTEKRAEVHKHFADGHVSQTDINGGISGAAQRRSLTSIYLEKKYHTGENDKDSAHVNGTLSEQHPSRSVRIIQNDIGPVRQSLISLVEEEDVPLLMEAMAEKLEFVFEDLDSSDDSSNPNEGILRKREKPAKQARIGFHTTPSVFTYPDEATATEHSQWDQGEHISFEHYQQLCNEERERLLREKAELEQYLRSTLLAKDVALYSSKHETTMEEPTADDCLLGVTGRILYSDVPPIARFNRNSRSLIAGK